MSPASSSRVSPLRSETTWTPGSSCGPVRTGVGDDDPQQAAGLLAAQLLDAPGGDHPPAGEDADGVAEPLDEVELVAGEDDRDSAPGLLEQRLGERVDADRVQPGERLVEDQHLGPADQRGGQLHPLLVAERQLLHRVAAPLPQAEPVDPLARGPRGGGAVQPVQPGEVGDLLADLHLRVEPALLRHVADAAADLLVQRPALPAHVAGVGADQPHGDAHRRRLAGAVGPAEAEHRPGGDGEAHAVEDLVGAEALAQAVELEHSSPLTSWFLIRTVSALPSRTAAVCGVIGP